MANFRQVKSILTSKMGQGPTKASLHITVDGSTEVEWCFLLNIFTKFCFKYRDNFNEFINSSPPWNQFAQIRSILAAKFGDDPLRDNQETLVVEGDNNIKRR